MDRGSLLDRIAAPGHFSGVFDGIANLVGFNFQAEAILYISADFRPG